MKICKNQVTDVIRSKFGANPLKVPDATYQPLIMLEIVNRRPKILGRFADLIEGDFDHDLRIELADLAEVSGNETKKIGIDLGFNILGNFLEAFGGKSPDFKSVLNGTKKISFTFSNVRRRWFSVLRLGKILSSNNLKAADSIFIERIMKNKKSKLALVTDVIISNSFSFSSYNENDIGVDMDIPLIEGVLGNVEAGLKIGKVRNNEIRFEKENPLSFAFSCVELLIDHQGNFKSGDWIENVRVKGIEFDKDSAELEVMAKYTLDEDDYNLLLIE